jgi:hypothetical protein
LAESQPSKLLVAGSIPVARSIQTSPGRSGERYSRDLRRAFRSPGFPPGTTCQVAGKGKREFAHVAQLAERVLGKDEVSSSILLVGSILMGHI